MADNSQFLKAILIKTAPELAKQIDAEWVAEQWKIRGARTAKYRRYSSGDHDAHISEQSRKMHNLQEAGDDKLEEWAMNYISIVIDKMASRLHVSDFNLGTDEANKWLDERMEESKFIETEGMVNRGAVRDANSYVIIDPETVTYKLDPAYDGYTGVVSILSDDNTIQWACKVWTEGSGEGVIENLSQDEITGYSQELYAIAYYGNKMTAWKGQVNGAGAEAFGFWNGQTEQEWKLDRLPVVMFVNKRDSNNRFGESEIRPALPIQNILNTTMHTTDMVEQLGAYPIPVIIGAKMDSEGMMPGTIVSLELLDADGNPITEVTEEQARLLSSIKHFTIQPADLDKYIAAMDAFVMQLTQVTQTPIYGVTTGGNLSGEALKQLEIKV